MPFPSPGDLPDPGIELMSFASLHWQADSLPAKPLVKPIYSFFFFFLTNTETIVVHNGILFSFLFCYGIVASLVAQMVMNLSAMQ